MKRITWLSLVGTVAMTGAATLVPAAHAAPQETTARLMVVQAVPGQSLQVEIDDETVTGTPRPATCSVLHRPAGAHQVTFLDQAGQVVVDTVRGAGAPARPRTSSSTVPRRSTATRSRRCTRRRRTPSRPARRGC